MDIRPEIGVRNPSFFDEEQHLFRGDKDYSNSKWSWDMYGYTPEDYRDRFGWVKEDAEKTTTHDWGLNADRPKTQGEIDHDKDEVERWLDMNNRMAWDDPHSPVQRMNQPMSSLLTDENGETGWQDGTLENDGNYTPAKSFQSAMSHPNVGGSFKDALLAMDDEAKQEWLNNNYGGRGLGYMGQNAYPSIPMAQRKQLVQQNARPALLRQLARMN